MQLKAYDLQKAVDRSNLHGVNTFNNQVQEDILFSTRPYNQKRTKYARKIRFYPTPKQRRFFKQAFGISRVYYNDSIALYNKDRRRYIRIGNALAREGCIYQNKKGEQCKKELYEGKWYCKKHKTNKIKGGTPLSHGAYKEALIKQDEPEWKYRIPYDCKDRTIKNAIGSVNAAQSNKRNGNIENYKMGFRTRKDLTQILYFPATGLKPGAKLCPKFLKKLGVPSVLEIRSKKDKRWLAKQFEISIQIKKERSKNQYEEKRKKFEEGKLKKEPKQRTAPYWDQLVSDFTIKFEYPDRYYLCVPSERKPLKKKTPHNVVALDPGVRTFQTYYSSKDVNGKIGDGFQTRLNKIGKRIDSINSQMSKELNERKKTGMRKRCFRLRSKAQNIVSELHNQTALFLCENFENILLPKFETQKMSHKGTRKINAKTVRSMIGLKHYTFYLKLLSKGEHYNRNVFRCNEAYTSKTCGGCGKIDEKLGSKTVYNCLDCGFVMDRDINGARNVLLRHIGFAITL